MSKNSLGELKLSPLKENGKFVFINNEVRVNGKLNKGDSIRIFVDSYEAQNGKYLITGNNPPKSRIVVRGTPLEHEHVTESAFVEDLYNKISEMYKNQFYFGKIEI